MINGSLLLRPHQKDYTLGIITETMKAYQIYRPENNRVRRPRQRDNAKKRSVLVI